MLEASVRLRKGVEEGEEMSAFADGCLYDRLGHYEFLYILINASITKKFFFKIRILFELKSIKRHALSF